MATAVPTAALPARERADNCGASMPLFGNDKIIWNANQIPQFLATFVTVCRKLRECCSHINQFNPTPSWPHYWILVLLGPDLFVALATHFMPSIKTLAKIPVAVLFIPVAMLQQVYRCTSTTLQAPFQLILHCLSWDGWSIIESGTGVFQRMLRAI